VGGRKEYSSRVRVNPVCFLLIPNILKVRFSFSVHRTEEERNIPAESELTQYVFYLFPTYWRWAFHLFFFTEVGGREEYSSSIRVNPVNFLFIPDILKVSFSYSIQGREKELIQYVSNLYPTYWRWGSRFLYRGGRKWWYSSRVPELIQYVSFSFSVQRREEERNIPARVRVNPVCFLLTPNILKVSFSFSVQRREEERNIPAESELIQYVSYLYPTYWRSAFPYRRGRKRGIFQQCQS
jgi:hypothetical protein